MNWHGFFTGLAVVLSLFALWRTWRVDKRDMFLRIHTDLLAEVPMAGRRWLRNTHTAEEALGYTRDQYATEVYRALALFDVLGLYVEQGWVDRWTVMDEWARSLRTYREPKRLWVEARWPDSDEPRWPHYDRLARSAEKYVEKGRPHWGRRHYLDWRDKVRRTGRRLA